MSNGDNGTMRSNSHTIDFSSSSPFHSPPVSCPPNWIFPTYENEERDSPELVEDVLKSSSPPNFQSSSPQSDHSTLTTPSDEQQKSSATSESQSTSEPHICAQVSSDYDELVAHGPPRDEFSTRLNDLLLAVIKESELRSAKAWLHETDKEWTSESQSSPVETLILEKGTPKKFPVDRHSSSFVIRWCQEQIFTESNRSEIPGTRADVMTSSKSLSLSASSVSRTNTDKTPHRSSSHGYRVIKRSYSGERKENDDADLEPHRKRAKIGRYDKTHAKDNVYAQKSASIRRARSLRTESTEVTTESWAPTVTQIPTEAATPQPHSPRSQHIVPIIAPPLWLVARLPLSSETQAKVRLGRFLEREGRERSCDGLIADSNNWPGISEVTSANKFGLDIEGNVYEDLEECNEPSDSGQANGTNVAPLCHTWTKVQWAKALGLGHNLRKQIIEWLLQVLPERRSQDPSAPASRSSSFASTSPSFYTSNLCDQLETSAETRFHAAWMFLRYFFLMEASEPSKRSGQCHVQGLEESQGEDSDLAFWDVAITCLALSVKFHRDFLDPLLPVYAFEFLRLAPHEISYQEFETTQRDVLSAFSYRLGVTPQPILDELWKALPSLRQLLSYEGGWNSVQKGTWWRLFDVIYAPDIMKFPQSLLATTALIDAIVFCLAARYDYQSSWCSGSAQRYPNERTSEHNKRVMAKTRKEKLINRAHCDAEGVIQDIQAVIGVTDDQLHDCQSWWSDSVARF